ncbi:MAG: Abi family protein, partial [Gammaproteobacteria bacterium]
PSWMNTELLPMGTWSTIYKNLANRSDKKRMSDIFKLSPVDLESWLHALTYIRNLCAHHSRLWNRHFTIRPKQIIEYIKYLTPNTTFAAQAAMIHVLLKIISPDSKWTARLYELFKNHPFINPTRMGFAIDWQDDGFLEA